MAVLIEANSVIIRAEALIARFAGGWAAFKERVPNQTLCTDNEIVRVGFVFPDDVEPFIGMLERNGLIHLREGEAIDIAVAVQLRGIDWRCSWLELGHVDLGNDPRRRIAACRLPGIASKQIVTPPGWEFEGSLSQIYGVACSEHKPTHQNGLDSYCGQELDYLGHASEVAA